MFTHISVILSASSCDTRSFGGMLMVGKRGSSSLLLSRERLGQVSVLDLVAVPSDSARRFPSSSETTASSGDLDSRLAPSIVGIESPVSMFA